MTGHGDRSGLQSDVAYSSKERDREVSLDGQSAQNMYMGNAKNHRGREDSEAKENNYFISSNAEKAGVSIAFDQ